MEEERVRYPVRSGHGRLSLRERRRFERQYIFGLAQFLPGRNPQVAATSGTGVAVAVLVVDCAMVLGAKPRITRQGACSST